MQDDNEERAFLRHQLPAVDVEDPAGDVAGADCMMSQLELSSGEMYSLLDVALSHI